MKCFDKQIKFSDDDQHQKKCADYLSLLGKNNQGLVVNEISTKYAKLISGNHQINLCKQLDNG